MFCIKFWCVCPWSESLAEDSDIFLASESPAGDSDAGQYNMIFIFCGFIF